MTSSVCSRCRVALVALLAVIGLVAAACSSSVSPPRDDSSPSDDVVDAAPVPTEPGTPTSASPTSTATSTTAPTSTTTSTIPAPDVRTGAARLVESDFALLDGTRVGLIAHQNSVVGESHLGDLLHAAPNVTLVAMFGPEHGVRGTADAGEYVDDAVDDSTGVPIFSLFGPTRKPTPDMLDGIDVLVFDLQDVGARYYTYISTMGLAMQAAAEADIDFVVLDRPNPLGGLLGGGVLEPERTSFVGQYPLTDTYGLTSFELARLIAANALLPGLDELTLDGVPLAGWDRSMRWEDTGLRWIPPSPAITTPDTALLYPATIYFESTNLSYGRGTDMPFEVIGAPWLDAEALHDDLASRDLPGVDFTATTIAPKMLPDMTVEPAYLGETLPALQLTVTDRATIEPSALGVHLLDAVFAQARSAGVDPLARPNWIDQLSGSDLLRRGIAGGEFTVEEILGIHAAQQAELEPLLESAHIH